DPCPPHRAARRRSDGPRRRDGHRVPRRSDLAHRGVPGHEGPRRPDGGGHGHRGLRAPTTLGSNAPAKGTNVHLDNTAAIVTGAASGLGAATAAHLADRGATVYGLDLEKAVAAVVPSAGVHLVPADVTDDEQVRAAVGRIRY